MTESVIGYLEHSTFKMVLTKSVLFFSRIHLVHLSYINFLVSFPSVILTIKLIVQFLIIVRLYSWVVTNIELLTVELKLGGGRQSAFNILYASDLKLATEQLIGCIMKFLDECNGE